ncbi:glycosyltransferase family 4 protein [Chloroflexota bacterium]
MQKLLQRTLRSLFWIISPNSWLDQIGTSTGYRTFSESFKNWRLLRTPSKVKEDQQKGNKIAHINWRFPAFSETFIRRELDQLVSSGINVQVFAEAPDPNLIDDEAITAWVNRTVYTSPIIISRLFYLFFYFLFLHPIKTVKLFLYILFHRYSYYKTLREDLVIFGKSLYLAGYLRNYGIQHIHSPWANQTAFLSMGAAYLLDLPFTVHVRAFDINHWKSQYGLAEILENADYIITNSEYNRSRINLIVKDKKIVHLIRNGVDTDKIIPNERPERLNSPVRILSVGRLIEPKGYIYLLQACALLVDKGISFECKIYGGRNFVSEIRSYMDIIAAYNTLKLENWVSFEGAQPFGEILKSYQWADIFVLPCVKSQTGEHDITPNAILEAMAMELPVVSTKVGGIPEIMIHQKTGLLVDPGDVTALSKALQTLIQDPDLRRKYGKAGRQQVIEHYNSAKNVSKIVSLFNQVQNQGTVNS